MVRTARSCHDIHQTQTYHLEWRLHVLQRSPLATLCGLAGLGDLSLLNNFYCSFRTQPSPLCFWEFSQQARRFLTRNGLGTWWHSSWARAVWVAVSAISEFVGMKKAQTGLKVCNPIQTGEVLVHAFLPRQIPSFCEATVFQGSSS